MIRPLLFAATVLLLGAAPSAVASHTSPSSGEGVDFAVGAGRAAGCTFESAPFPPQCQFPARRFAFSAVSDSGPGPQPAVGFLAVMLLESSPACPNGDCTLIGRVDCLLTAGDHAQLGGVVIRATGFVTPVPPGSRFREWVRDDPDGFSPQEVLEGVGCTPPVSFLLGYLPVVQGEIVVHDG